MCLPASVEVSTCTPFFGEVSCSCWCPDSKVSSDIEVSWYRSVLIGKQTRVKIFRQFHSLWVISDSVFLRNLWAETSKVLSRIFTKTSWQKHSFPLKHLPPTLRTCSSVMYSHLVFSSGWSSIRPDVGKPANWACFVEVGLLHQHLGLHTYSHVCIYTPCFGVCMWCTI